MTYSPPIPSYAEAVGAGPSSPLGSLPPESLSLLNPAGPSRSRPSHHARAGRDGYRAPGAETDDSGSDEYEEDDDGCGGGGDDVDEDEDETNLVRREMQEFELEEGEEGGGGDSSSSSSSSVWSKRLSFGLPTWKWTWRWRLPRFRFQIRLASGPEPPSLSLTSPPPDPTGAGALPATDWSSLIAPGAQLLFLVARLLALFLILGFFYLLFSGTLVSSLTSGGGSPYGSVTQPPAEAVRSYLLDGIDPRRLRASVRHYTAYAHLAGSQGGYAAARDVETMFRRAGLEGVDMDEYQVYINYPVDGGRGVELLRPGPDQGPPTWEAQLEEDDPGEETAGRLTRVFHAHSRGGIGQGPLIYANHGTPDDLAALRRWGIDTTGAVALVRHHGGSAQGLGLKVRAAEEAGFAGCLVYDDPADDGPARGAAAPAGPFLPPDGVRRAGVALSNFVIGDPLTPGWESRRGLPRMDRNLTRALVGIPSLPLGWRDASALLRQLQGFGHAAPADWIGGGGGGGGGGDGGGGGGSGVAEWEWWTGNRSGPTVRLRNLQDEASEKTIWNVRGRIPGREQGDKAIILGNGHDALAFGASSPHSGTAVMIELARLLGGLAAQGWRPLRTIEFASWDGEAYNHAGSTEFVEHRLQDLRRDAAAHVSLAGAVAGLVAGAEGAELRASGSPAFREVLARALRRVGDGGAGGNEQHRHRPDHGGSSGRSSGGGGTLQAQWDLRGGRIETPSPWEDGSHVPFLMLAGTSSLDVRFEGPAGQALVGSGHDSFRLMDEVRDPGWRRHAMLTKVVGLLLIDLADRPLLPLDMSAYGEALEAGAARLGGFLDEHEKINGGTDSGQDQSQAAAIDAARRGTGQLLAAAQAIHRRAAELEKWEAGWKRAMLASGGSEDTAVRDQRMLRNGALADFETALLDQAPDGGYPNRTQFRHVFFGPRDWGTAGEEFPAIRDAVSAGDWGLAGKLVGRAVEAVNRAEGVLAAAAIEGGSGFSG